MFVDQSLASAGSAKHVQTISAAGDVRYCILGGLGPWSCRGTAACCQGNQSYWPLHTRLLTDRLALRYHNEQDCGIFLYASYCSMSDFLCTLVQCNE